MPADVALAAEVPANVVMSSGAPAVGALDTADFPIAVDAVVGQRDAVGTAAILL